MASVETIICPTDCSSTLPVVSFSECAPTLLQAQISDMFIWNDGYAFTDWTDMDELLSRISDDSTDANAVRQLPMIGALTISDGTEKKLSHGRKSYGPKEYSIDADIDDNSDTNYEASRATGCNRQYRALYATLGGKLYGGNTGILGNLRMSEPIVSDDLEFVTIKVAFKWTSQFAPLRIDNPLA